MGGREPGGRVRSGNVREHRCGSTAVGAPPTACGVRGGLENLSAQEAVCNLPQKALIYVNY